MLWGYDDPPACHYQSEEFEVSGQPTKKPRQNKPLSFYPHDLKGVLAATLKVKPQAKKKKAK